MRSATLKLSPLDSFHPNTKQIPYTPAIESEILIVLSHPSCVGLGEIGLHYHCATTDIRNG